MRNITHIEYPKSSLPVSSVNVGPSESGVIGNITWPSLDSHIVDVNPPTKRRFPTYFGLSNLNNPWIFIRLNIKIQVSNGNPSAGITLPYVT